MSSNDNAITLTTHRVLQKSSESNKEIMLKDIVSHEVIKKRSKYYLFLTVFFITLLIICTIFYFSQGGTIEYTEINTVTAIIGIFFILTLFALYLYIMTREKFLKLTGRFNEIEFPLNNLNKSSLNKFLNRLTVESENRKRED